MKTLQYIINEKLHLGKHSHVIDDEILERVVTVLSDWLNEKDEYNGVTNNRIEFLFKDKSILLVNFIDCFEDEFAKLANKCKMPILKFEDYLIKHNDEIIKLCEESYRKIYTLLPF